MAATAGVRILLPATAESVPAVRRELGRLLDETGGRERAADVALAVTEACANVAVHAYTGEDAPGPLEVSAHVDRERTLTVEIRDRGRGLQPWHESAGLGLGLPLIARLADVLEVESDPGDGTLVRMAFALDGTGVVDRAR